jgi:bacillithiol biosynthesis cysteine-adding enzyme BshC
VNIWHKIPINKVLPNAKTVEVSEAKWTTLIEQREFLSARREILSEVILKQYRQIQCNSEVEKNILSLKQSNTFTVTTGQQIVTALGPWMVLYKIATAIKLAKDLAIQFPSHHFVPVFWMATEDHDWAEIAEIKKGEQLLRWDNPLGGAVGRLSCDTTIQALQNWNDLYPEWRLNNDVFHAYIQQETLAEATRWLVHHVFGHHGLVVVDGDDAELKSMASDLFHAELSGQKLFQLAQKHNCVQGEIEIKPYNVFQLSTGQRIRVQSKEEAEMFLSENDFSSCSPNVALRIFYQESILPNLAYIGGPSEQKYWNQVAPFFADLGISQPLFILRDRGVVVPEKWCRKWDALLWDKDQSLHPKQCFESDLRNKYGSAESLSELKKSILTAYELHYSMIASEDATLLNAAKGDCVKSIQMVEQLEKKIQRSRKRKEDETFQFAQRWDDHFNPKNHLAERWDFWIFEWQKNKHIVDVLIEQLDWQDPSFKIWSY